MRILFFNSSLEAGRDGVGDYTRLLAAACARRGHVCAIAALNDPFVAEPSERDDTLRLPASLDGRRRIELVRAFRERFRPDWISFHLVPFAFQKRGMLLGLIPALRALTRDVPLHLMFHELWLGAGRPSSWRFRVAGRLQSFGIRRLIAALRPRLVTTSNPVYAAMLRSLGGEARVLPLFGNVPVEAAPAPLEKLLPGSGITEENRAGWQIGLFFGSLPEQWKPEPFLGVLRNVSRRNGRKTCLVLAGRAGEAGETIWRGLERDYGKEILFLRPGEQPPAVISSLLQRADFGVAASPWQLIGKSGTVAAMLDHGLPTIVTRDDFQPFYGQGQPPSDDSLLYRCDENLEAELVTGLPRRPPRARADEIAAQLLDSLSPP